MKLSTEKPKMHMIITKFKNEKVEILPQNLIPLQIYTKMKKIQEIIQRYGEKKNLSETEITIPVSYPNSKPPIPATTVNPRTYLLLKYVNLLSGNDSKYPELPGIESKVICTKIEQ